MTSKSPVRSAEDIDEASLSYAEIKALASGNPKIKEKMDLDVQINKLKLAKANYLSEKYDLEYHINNYYPRKITSIKERINVYQKDLESTSPTEEFEGMTLQGNFYPKKEVAGKALLFLCEKEKSSNIKKIGEYRGFEMHLSYDQFYSYHLLTLKKNGTYMVELGNDVYGNITRIDNQISSISKKIKTENELLTSVEQQLQNAKEEAIRPFDKEQELQEKLSRLAELNKELDIGKGDDTIDLVSDNEYEEIEIKKKNQIR